MTPSSDQHTPLGYHAFDRLQAEYEALWLEDVFVRPLDFDTMAGMRSIVVFGASGSGKTALRMALARRVEPADAVPTQLVVDWRPSAPSPGQSGSQAVRECLAQVLDACATALLRHLGRWPDAFTVAPDWVQETIVWFVHQYLQGDRALLLSRLEEGSSAEGIALLHNVITRSPRPVLSSDAPPSRVIAELANAIRRLNLNGVWVLVDGLEPWLEAEAEPLAGMLKALLSTLALFEDPGFALKLLAPVEIEPAVTSSGGIVRRRLDVYRLDWPAEILVSILERRLAAASGRSMFRLADLCAARELTTWLKQYGGTSPRGWLELMGPLAEAYIARGLDRPLSTAEWMALYRRHPPRLRLDLTTGQVFVGYGEVNDLQPMAYKLLRYLYEQRRLCTKDELYYRAYRGMAQVPHSLGDHDWESPKAWGGAVDTILWRLRQKIELDPRKPLYIISDRGKGVRLENVW